MRPELPSPKILQPGELQKLNEQALRKLGAPIFFITPQILRPSTSDVIGRFYETATGLYVVYKDYGMKILNTFFSFCASNQFAYSGFVWPHWNNVQSLRGAVCHGWVPGGIHVKRLCRTMRYYFPEEAEQGWPEAIATLEAEKYGALLDKLCADSDRVIRYIYDCIDQIAADEELLAQWRTALVQDALNGQERRYGNNYFDGRIVNDLEEAARGQSRRLASQLAVRDWLLELEPRLLAGRITDSDELFQTLAQALRNLYHPEQLGNQRSSADLIPDELWHCVEGGM